MNLFSAINQTRRVLTPLAPWTAAVLCRFQRREVENGFRNISWFLQFYFHKAGVIRMRLLIVGLLLMVAGCGQRPPAAQQTIVPTNENQWVWSEDASATLLESNAAVVFTVEGTRAGHAVRLMRPSPTVTNDLVSSSDFQSTLASVQGRGLAVVEMNALGFDTNRLTNAAVQLRQCGFQNVHAVVTRWGRKFVGPPL